jgi:hypothetical protein
MRRLVQRLPVLTAVVVGLSFYGPSLFAADDSTDDWGLRAEPARPCRSWLDLSRPIVVRRTVGIGGFC